MVPIVPLVLFSGSDVDICVSSGVTYVTLANNWIKFHVENHQVTNCVHIIIISKII